MKENDWTRISGRLGYMVYRAEIDEQAKRLKFGARCKRGNKQLVPEQLIGASPELRWKTKRLPAVAAFSFDFYFPAVDATLDFRSVGTKELLDADRTVPAAKNRPIGLFLREEIAEIDGRLY